MTHDRWECITALIEAGADARAMNDNNEKPADLAECKGAVSVAAYVRKAEEKKHMVKKKS